MMDDTQTAFAAQYPYGFDLDMMKVSCHFLSKRRHVRGGIEGIRAVDTS